MEKRNNHEVFYLMKDGRLDVFIKRNLARDLNLEVGQGNQQQKRKVFHELRMFY